MTIADWLMIVAVLSGPVIAVQLTRYLDKKKEEHSRKLTIFKTLMATRSENLSPEHVQALNRIDLEFDRSQKAELEVINAWKAYLDHLGQDKMSPEQWGIRRIDLFVELLHKMATVLNYQFDKTHIRNSAYSPRLYGELEAYQNEMRNAMRELMSGHRPLPVFIANAPPEGEQESKQTQQQIGS